MSMAPPAGDPTRRRMEVWACAQVVASARGKARPVMAAAVRAARDQATAMRVKRFMTSSLYLFVLEAGRQAAFHSRRAMSARRRRSSGIVAGGRPTHPPTVAIESSGMYFLAVAILAFAPSRPSENCTYPSDNAVAGE